MQNSNEKLPFRQIAHFPKLFLDYVDQKEDLSSLYNHFPSIDGFKKQIEEKQFTHREVLTHALKNQYSHLEKKPDLEILNHKNTFTVTTGHQLNIFTGPLYVIYKIISTINLAKKLKEAFPDYNFVPVYWMATEDHDFEEIASFNLFNDKYTWETDQKGAVGRMNPEGVLALFDQLKEKPDLFRKAYSENKTLANAVRQYMNELFGEQGLVCVDGDDHELKKLFIPVVLDELKNNSVKKLLDKNALELEAIGQKPQINARDINLFYLDDNLRERIEFDNGTYSVVDTDIQFSQKEIEALVESNPEKFSPNVSLRPLYQEIILPNLAYLGGPSELAYWLQLKGVFDYYKVTYPVLMPRNLALVINEGLQKRMEKLDVTAEELYLEDSALKKAFVERNSKNTLSLSEEEKNIGDAYEQIGLKAEEVDPTLKAVIEAEKVKTLKSLSNLEARIKKAEERKFETSINQLLNVKDRLFPGGGQQERKDNFLNFYLNDPQFLDKLYASLDPLDLRFNIIYL